MTMSSHNQIVLAYDKSQTFFVVYRCVNQVSSYNTFYTKSFPNTSHVNSIHLRSNTSCFTENMNRRVQPLHDTSSHLCFPTTSSNNLTTMGRDNDMVYFTNAQTLFDALAFGQHQNLCTNFSVNNRNYTMLLHGIENRWDCLLSLECKDSVRFTRNSAFPPLKSASSYVKTTGNTQADVICQNQIYQNSFAVNTQRQTDQSLVETSKDLLAHILEFAVTDLSLNRMCVEWELKLRRNLSFPEKCHILVYHEVMRKMHVNDPVSFQTACQHIHLMEYDDVYKRNLFGVGRCKRNNPEMIHLFPHLPTSVRKAVLQRWARENKMSCLKHISDVYPKWKTASSELDCLVPSKLSHWTTDDILMVVHHLCGKMLG